MSHMTKRKYVAREVLEEFVTPNENQQIVKVIASRGNNLHKVETASRETYLVSMPTKFRKSVWIKRGDFVVVDPIEEGDKVKAEIIHILYKHQIRHIKQEGLWPKQFDDMSNSAHSMELRDSSRSSHSEASNENTSESDNEADLFVNTNRLIVPCDEPSDCSSSSESDDEDDLFVNTNRLIVPCDEPSDCSSSSDSETDEEN